MKRKWIIGFIFAAFCCSFFVSSMAGQIVIPAGTTVVEDETFFGDQSLTDLVLPEGLLRIGSKAFANTSLRSVSLPFSLEYFAKDTFEGCPKGFEISVYAGSKAETLCLQYGIKPKFIRNVEINKKNFPDSTFRNYVSQFDLDNNGSLNDDEIDSVKTIRVYRKPIGSLKGIEWFSALEYLYCAGCEQLTYLDVGQNKKLKEIDCSSCAISSLKLAKTTSLVKLNCGGNMLSSLDVSGFTKLQELRCGGNQLQSIDVSYNKKLNLLSVDDNHLTTIDLSNNPILKHCYCEYNNISSLDLSNNPDIEYVACRGTLIEKLDFSANSKLKQLLCGEGNLSVLTLGNKPALGYLECSVSNLSKLDLTNAPALEILYCIQCNLSTLDVSHNGSLTTLWCGVNRLKNIDISHNPLLVDFACNSNKLKSIDISNNASLREFNCQGNEITSLDLRNNPLLSDVWACDNDFSTLYIAADSSLDYLIHNSTRYSDSGWYIWSMGRYEEGTSCQLVVDDFVTIVSVT